MATRAEPDSDPLQERPELLARYVVERVERDDGVERAWFERHRRVVLVQERPVREVLLRTPDLFGRDVGPGRAGAAREDRGRADPGPGSELEHIRMLG